MTKKAGRAATVVLLALGLVSLWASGCTDPVAALGAINATSSQPISNPPVAAHTHRCTIPLSDVNDPPAGGKPYVTTSDGAGGLTSHSHNVVLREAQLASLQDRNASLAVSTEPEAGHTHTFLFVR